MSKRLMVIGLDGAELSLIKKWIEQRKLPTFKKLIDNGTFGLLKSTLPPITPPAWTSAFTGVNPGKHNIFGFFVHEGYDLRLVNATDRKAKAVWEVLSEKGLKVIVVNVPVTYPPEKVNGIMISGMVGFRAISRDYTYPKEIKNELAKIGYILDVPLEARLGHILDAQHPIDMTEKRRQAVIHLMKNYPWDLFIVVFSALDRVQHFFWKYMNSSSGESPLRDVILKTYEALDNVINELLGLVDRDTNFIFFSDHGFGPLHKEIFLNNWFKNLGLLKLVERSEPGVLKRIVHRLPNYMKSPFARRRRIGPPIAAGPQALKNIDWSKTKAWLEASDGRVTINLRGRKPLGIVESGEEYEDLKNYIIEKLSEFRDPDNGERVIEKVHRGEEIYHGPYTRNGPDLLVEPMAGYILENQPFGEQLFKKPERSSADHRPHGIFISYGPDIKKGHEIRNAVITDIAPTILYMMGMSIPPVTDGRVLREIFEEGSELATTAVKFEDFEEIKRRVRPREIYTKKEEEEIKERLRRLGYI